MEQEITMPYVLRDTSGKVKGTLRWKPVDSAEGNEFLPEDHPEVVAFRNRPKPDQGPSPADKIIAALKRKGVITDADLA